MMVQPTKLDVLFVSMPFGLLNSPSLGLSLLDASLDSLNLATDTKYFSIPFAKRFGTGFYNLVTGGFPQTKGLLGEWLFSEGLFGPESEEAVQGYIDDVLRHGHPAHAPIGLLRLTDSYLQKILRIRSQIESFLDECLEAVLARPTSIVGFTSVFQQNVASLALAKRIKAASPDTKILMGGANCEGEMGEGLIEYFPFLDYVVSGEGDLVFPRMVEMLLNGDSPAELQGVYTRTPLPLLAAGGCAANAPSVSKMDDLPIPSFAKYFEQLEAIDEEVPVNLPNRDIPRLLVGCQASLYFLRS